MLRLSVVASFFLMVACAGPRWSTLTELSSTPLGSAANTWGAIQVEVPKIDPHRLYIGVLMVKQLPDVPGGFARKDTLGKQIDSLPAGSYAVTVRLVGYTAAHRDVQIQAGQLLRLRADMRESHVRLQEVAD